MKSIIILVVFILLIAPALFAQPEFVNNAEDAEMLIVTHDDLRDAGWEADFLSVKDAQGIDVFCHDIADGIDKDELLTWIEANCVDLQYILIIGDAHRSAFMRPYINGLYDPEFPDWTVSDSDVDEGNFVPLYGDIIDAEFSRLGDVPIWNDSEYGASFDDCRVGRVPAESISEIENYMDKCVEYYALNNPEWAKTVVFLQGDIYYPCNNISPDFFDAWLEDAYVEALNISVTNIINQNFKYSTNNSFLGGKNPWYIRQDSLETMFNAGRGVITAGGTGGLPGMFVEMYYGKKPDPGEDPFEDFSNEGEYPFILGFTCDLGSFDYWNGDDDQEDTCVIEQWMVMDDAGIIGAIAPNWWTVPQHCDDGVVKANELIFQNSITEFGQLTEELKAVLHDEWDDQPGAPLIDAFMLFGDPTLHLPYNAFSAGHWFTDVTVTADITVADGETLTIEPGVTVRFEDNAGLYIAEGGCLIADGTSESPIVFEAKDGGEEWDGIRFNSSDEPNHSSIKYCEITDGYYGILLTSQTSSEDIIEIENCTVSDCRWGIRLLNSYANITNNVCEDNPNSGIRLSSCSSGKVILDGNTCNDNGSAGSSQYYCGVRLYYSSPEIKNCEIYDNNVGVTCYYSSPDMNTYFVSGPHPNSIYSNGSGEQTGASGAEIYLSLTSVPHINYNNIYDGEITQVGAMIYRVINSNSTVLDAENNYWGQPGVESTDFRWTELAPPKSFEEVFDISPESENEIDDVSNWDLAIAQWEAGEYSAAMPYFRRAMGDGIADVINSIHYLTGCYLKTGSDLSELREHLQNLADNSEDRLVALTAHRFATNCLTEVGNYEDAAAEYLRRSQNVDCRNDSIMAVIDYLLVCEMGDFNVNNVATDDIPNMIDELLEMLDEEGNSKFIPIPTEYILYQAYPNPFNSTSVIKFGLPEKNDVKIQVYDLLGRLVTTLLDNTKQAGYHSVVFDGSLCSSGVYYYKIEAGTFNKTMKFTLLR
ncbi:MAG: C25 family cysteine peptidase [Candidatus Hatepunaea meridiana]|nr:C25 family cysteine peptidase [Candidatus Hatepunaea meridiana]